MGQQWRINDPGTVSLQIRNVDPLLGRAGVELAIGCVITKVDANGIYVTQPLNPLDPFGETGLRFYPWTTVDHIIPNFGLFDPASNVLLDRSLTIAAPSVSQQVMAANPGRQYLLLQNVSDTTMWFNFSVAAVANKPSCELPPHCSFVMEGSWVSQESVWVICASSGKSLTAKEDAGTSDPGV